MKHDDTPLSTHYLHHLTDTDVIPGETLLAATYALGFLTALTAILALRWWLL